MEAHDQLARAANALAAPLGTKGPEGIFNLGDLDPEEAFKPSGIDEVLVFNTLPWERKVIVEEPEPRGGAAPVGMLDTFFNRRSAWGGPRPIPRSAVSPAPSRRWATPSSRSDGVTSSDLKVDGRTIENRALPGALDPKTGAIAELLDKALGHDFAGDYQGWRPGEYIYETVDHPDDRLAIADIDFYKPEFFIGHKDTPWRRSARPR